MNTGEKSKLCEYEENSVQEEQDPLELAKEMMTANWSKANAMSIIICFVVFTMAALLGIVDGNQCGLITAFLPVDAVSAGIIFLTPISYFAMQKYNLNVVLVAFCHSFLFMGILCLHKFFLISDFFKWYGIFLIAELISVLSFGFPKYIKTMLLSNFGGGLILASFVVTIKHVDRGTSILHNTRLSTVTVVVIIVALVAVIIQLWQRKDSAKGEKQI